MQPLRSGSGPNRSSTSEKSPQNENPESLGHIGRAFLRISGSPLQGRSCPDFNVTLSDPYLPDFRSLNFFSVERQNLNDDFREAHLRSDHL